MAKVSAELIKPLDGDAEGTVRDFDPLDFDALEALGAVKRADPPGANKAQVAAPKNKAAHKA